MQIDAIVQQISHRDFWAFTSDDIDVLAHVSSAEYAEVVSRLLASPVQLTGLSGLAYRAAYRPRVTGCVLFTMRPQAALYETVLHGAFGIADPTSIKHGAAALVQVRSTPQVAYDVMLAALALQASDWIIEQSLSLLYWIGFTPRALQRQRMPELYDPPITALWQERTRPMVTADQATAIAHEIMRSLLTTFERHQTGAVARECIALLTLVNTEEYPNELALRIVQAYRRAQASEDEFVRQRVESASIRELLARKRK